MRQHLLRALLCLLALCAGCARTPNDGRQVVRFWAMGYEGEVVAQLLPEFERRNPGIHVDLQQLPWTAAHEKLLTAFAGDSLPDVCSLGNTCVVGTTVYGLPWYSETRVPYYRRDLLAKAGITTPPKSWDEWRAAMAAIKREVGPKRYAILLPLNEFEPLLNLAIQQSDPLLRDGGRYGNFRSVGYRRALTFYKEMFDKGWAPSVSNVQISNVWDEFGNGFYSFYISGPWNIAEFKKRLPPSQQGDWMTMPLPGPDGPGASVAGGTTLVLFQRSQRKDAAWKLVEYLSEPAVQVRFHDLTGDLPPRRSAWSTPALANDPYARAFRDQLERARPTPKVPEWERIATEIELVAEQMTNGRLTVDQAAVEMDRRTDAILEKRRWMLDHGTTAGAQ